MFLAHPVAYVVDCFATILTPAYRLQKHMTVNLATAELLLVQQVNDQLNQQAV